MVSLKRKFGYVILAAGLLLLCNLSAPYSWGAAMADLTVYYTASLNGNLDGCMCTKIRRAGIVKRAAFQRQLAGKNATVLVDAGDVFEYQSGDKIRSKFILQVYRDLKYDAIGLGDNELAGGILENHASYPFIVNNLTVNPGSGLAPFAQEPLLLQKGKYRVGIFALLEPQFASLAPVTELMSNQFQITPVEEAALQMTQWLKSHQADLVIMLYHGQYDRCIQLVKKVPGINLVILGHEQRLMNLEMAGRTGIVSPGEEGNRVGILPLSLVGGQVVFGKNSFREFSYGRDPDDPAVRKMVNQYYSEMSSRLQRTDNNSTPASTSSK